MTKETSTILDAYNTMHTPAKSKITKLVENVNTKETTKSKVIVTEDIVPVAYIPGTYSNFTGKIRTPGVWGTVENAKFIINDDKSVSFSGGTWLDGVWSGRGSIWNNGTWKNGTWKTGYWADGVWENGLHKGGVFAGGIWKNGTWDYGVFDGGTWEDGLWKDGDWSKEAKWIKGRDSEGEEHDKAPFHWGGMKYSKVTDPSVAATRREASIYHKGNYKTGTPGLDTFEDDPNKEMIDTAAIRGSERVSSVSESVKRYLKGTKILGKMIKEDDDVEDKELVDEKKKTEDIDTEIKDDMTDISTDSEDLSPEDLEQIELMEQLSTTLGELALDELYKIQKFIADGFVCVEEPIDGEGLGDEGDLPTELPELPDVDIDKK